MKLALVYHKIDSHADFGLSTVTPERFSDHLEFLAESGYQFETLSRLQSSPSVRCCAIVFDDAYANVLQYALPVMEKFQIPGTMAVIADYVGKENSWDVPFGPRCRHCTWADLQLLTRYGWETASHSCSHRALVGLSDGEIDKECNRSKELLQDRLGVAVDHFVYPFGRRNDRTDTRVRKAGYQTMSGFFAGATGDWIRRRPVYRWDDRSALRRKINDRWNESVKEASIQFWSRATIMFQPIWMA